PGDPEASELIRRITSSEEYEVMPPPDINKPLSAEQIQTLRQWIAEGAEWAPHWAYVPPVRHEAPQVSGDPPPANWIDNFILARLESEGIAPSPPADRITLFRRIYFDLIGLPPTREQAEAFLADDSDDAYV